MEFNKVRRTKEEANETRRAILQSALDTFYEKGYSKTTFDEIARRINLTKGAVYWHFRNKPDIIAALINEHIEYHIEQMEKSLPQMKNFDDILNFFLYSADHILKDENRRKMAFFITCQMEWSEAVIAKVLPQIKSKGEFGLTKIREALVNMYNNGEIDEDINIERLTHIIMSVWTGILDTYFSKRSTEDLKVMVTETFSLIFKGLKKEKTENAGK